MGFVRTLLVSAAATATAAAGAAAGTAPRPVVQFMDSTFYLTKSSIETLQGIGFDPVNERLYSLGVRDICGSAQMIDFTPDSGVSWDPVNGEMWLISTVSREVYRYVNGTAEVIFTIPETFDVPGVGSQTLYSPQGLALDESHVYVVDAGENLGERDGNQWFKFTRDGTPVSSSAATDFVANIDAPADDAVVDGITWCPPSSPFAPGLFLVPVEHTGIMVIDEDGFFVDDITWADAGLTYGEAVPFAFAGITIDPVTGDLYLVENGGTSHVWVRVPDERPLVFGNPTSLGIAVHWPDLRCRRLLLGNPAPDLVFGLGYRTTTGLLFGTNFNTGELRWLDPITGDVVSTEAVENHPGNTWGAAYDTERDDLYLYHGSSDRIWVVEDPDAPVATELPGDGVTSSGGTDIAYRDVDQSIYVVAWDGEPVLVRRDRNTGEATIIGPTENVSGLTYYPEDDTLIGISQSSRELFAIDPSTGLALSLGVSGTQASWEGLALAHTAGATVGVGDPGASAAPGAVLKAFPSPFRSSTNLRFTLERAADVALEVFDVAGRRVYRTAQVGRCQGSHTVAWDGTDVAGRRVAAGTYFLRLVGDGVRRTGKVLVLP